MLEDRDYMKVTVTDGVPEFEAEGQPARTLADALGAGIVAVGVAVVVYILGGGRDGGMSPLPTSPRQPLGSGGATAGRT